MHKYEGNSTQSVQEQEWFAKKLIMASNPYHIRMQGAHTLEKLCYKNTRVVAWDDEYYDGTVPNREETATRGLGYMNPEQRREYFWRRQAPVLVELGGFPAEILWMILRYILN